LKTLVSIFGPRIKGVALVYLLLIADNLAWVALPAFTGRALDGLLSGSYGGLIALIGVWIAGSVLSTFRQSYDTRLFTSLSSEFASSVAARHAAAGKSISLVSARSNLSREVVSFFAQELPMACRGAIAALGALVVLFTYDVVVAAICAAVLVPTSLANARFFSQSRWINRRLNNRLEREIIALGTESSRAVRRHYLALARRRVMLSDREALTSLVMRIAALVALVLLLLNVSAASWSPGDMYAMIAYAMMFFTGLVDVPLFVGAVARFRDIMARLE